MFPRNWLFLVCFYLVFSFFFVKDVCNAGIVHKTDFDLLKKNLNLRSTSFVSCQFQFFFSDRTLSHNVVTRCFVQYQIVLELQF